MRKTRSVGLAVLAVFALSAVVTSEASAKVKTEWKAPQIGKCTKVGANKGLYGTAKCGTKLEKETGEWEWEPGSVNLNYTSETGKAVLESEAGNVECTSSTDKGHTIAAEEKVAGEGSKKDVDTLTFVGCKSAGVPCQTVNPPEGVITTEELATELKASGAEVFQTYVNKAGEAGVLAKFKCGAVSFVVSGKVAGVITVLDKMSTEYKLNFGKGVGLQELKLTINGSPVKTTPTQVVKGTLTFVEKTLEIKSVGN